MKRETIFKIGYLDEEDIINEIIHSKEEYDEEITREQAERGLYEVQSMDYDYIMENNDFDEVVLIGTVGLWHGRKESAKYIKETNELRNLFSNYDEIEFEKEGRHLYVNLHHHDGCHYFEILRLNNKGHERVINLPYYEDIELIILNDIDKFKRNYTKCFFNNNKQYLI